MSHVSEICLNKMLKNLDGVKRIKIPEEIKKYIPPTCTVFMKHGDTRYILLEKNTGQMYVLFYIAKKPRRCVDLCGHNLKRWHATCLWCSWGKIWRNKNIKFPYVKITPVTLYMLWIVKGRRYAFLKAAIMKKLLTIVEMLAH